MLQQNCNLFVINIPINQNFAIFLDKFDSFKRHLSNIMQITIFCINKKNEETHIVNLRFLFK